MKRFCGAQGTSGISCAIGAGLYGLVIGLVIARGWVARGGSTP